MNEKYEYIYELAEFLNGHGKKMKFSELIDHLNTNNIKTDSGEAYKAGRGVASLVDSVYDCVKEEKGKDNAGKVADAFVDRDKEHAWKK